MEFSHRDVGNVTILSISGELDATCEPALRAAMEELLTRPDLRLIIDLASVTFMDSLTLSLLIEATNRVRESGGRLALACADRTHLRVIWLTGLHRWLPLHDDLETALGSVSDATHMG